MRDAGQCSRTGQKYKRMCIKRYAMGLVLTLFCFAVLQAKTTKKIVLRLQCNVCKAVHMHAIKVRRRVVISIQVLTAPA